MNVSASPHWAVSLPVCMQRIQNMSRASIIFQCFVRLKTWLPLLSRSPFRFQTPLRLSFILLVSTSLNQVCRSGYCAFTHKAGIHAKAILNNPSTYEILKPEDFGLTRYVSIGYVDPRLFLVTFAENVYQSSSHGVECRQEPG